MALRKENSFSYILKVQFVPVDEIRKEVPVIFKISLNQGNKNDLQLLTSNPVFFVA